MKKSIGILSALAILVSMSSCGDSNNSETDSSSESISSESSESSVSEDSLISDDYSETEESSEETTEPTKSEEELKAERLARNAEYLEDIQLYLLDVTVCDIADAHFEECSSVSEESYSGFDTATIITVGYDYNTTTTRWIESVDIIDSEGNSVVQATRGTAWEVQDVHEDVWGVTRYRIPGEYAPEDLKIKLVYDDEVKTSVEKDLSQTATFEEFGENVYWCEHVNPYWEDAEEAAEVNTMPRPCIYKINGVYCFVCEVFGTSSGFSTGEKKISYVGRGFDITPLQGVLAPVLKPEDITIESGNTQPYMYCELDEFNEYAIDNKINVNICCVTSDTDWYYNWDSIPEEQKMGKEYPEDLVTKYIRYEARDSYLCVPDGDGGITKIECTQM